MFKHYNCKFLQDHTSTKAIKIQTTYIVYTEESKLRSISKGRPDSFALAPWSCPTCSDPSQACSVSSFLTAKHVGLLVPWFTFAFPPRRSRFALGNSCANLLSLQLQIQYADESALKSRSNLQKPTPTSPASGQFTDDNSLIKIPQFVQSTACSSLPPLNHFQFHSLYSTQPLHNQFQPLRLFFPQRP